MAFSRLRPEDVAGGADEVLWLLLLAALLGGLEPEFPDIFFFPFPPFPPLLEGLLDSLSGFEVEEASGFDELEEASGFDELEEASGFELAGLGADGGGVADCPEDEGRVAA